jgi:Ras-related GTP-binding protein C/D
LKAAIDIQQDDSYHEAILPFVKVMIRAHLANPSMKFAVFIHKAEVLSEDYRGGQLLDETAGCG